MTFGEAVRFCVTRAFTYSGRARRSEFWWFVLFLQLVSLVVAIVFALLTGAAVGPALANLESNTAPTNDDVVQFAVVVVGILALQLLVSAILTVPLLAANARRLHDLDESAHWLWFYLAGLGIVPMLMGIQDGTPGPNRYGPDPKAAERLVPTPASPR